jgi:hypothetical protein
MGEDKSGEQGLGKPPLISSGRGDFKIFCTKPMVTS